MAEQGAFDIATPQSQKRFGNLGYNGLRGPSGFSFDGALHKTFKMTERQKLTFRADAFNFFNHKRLSNPVSSLANPNFGNIISASGGGMCSLR